MNIKEAKNAIKIGYFVLQKHNKNKINIKYLPSIDENLLTSDVPRVYLFVQDGSIKKIGGSSGKGGIKATMNFYVSAMTGSPGSSRFVCHLLIAEALKRGSRVELYMITSPKFSGNINGLFSSEEVDMASYKEMEDLCKADYYSREKRYPDWNFQENNEPYPTRLARLHNLYHKQRLNAKK